MGQGMRGGRWGGGGGGGQDVLSFIGKLNTLRLEFGGEAGCAFDKLNPFRLRTFTLHYYATSIYIFCNQVLLYRRVGLNSLCSFTVTLVQPKTLYLKDGVVLSVAEEIAKCRLRKC